MIYSGRLPFKYNTSEADGFPGVGPHLNFACITSPICYLRAVGRKVLWSSACVCLSVCLSVRTVFVRKIYQEPVHGSPPNLVGGSRG